MAVPLRVQNSGLSLLDGKSYIVKNYNTIDKMKFVDYPVVDNTPILFDVL